MPDDKPKDSKATRKTPQELEEENRKLLETLDKPKEAEEKTGEKPEENEEEGETEKVASPPNEETEEKPEETEEIEVKEPIVETVPKPTPEPDYKRKFSESSKEAQKIVAKNRKLNQAIDEASEIGEPTEDELRAEYSDWDVLDDTTKRIAKESLISTRRFAAIEKGREESKKIEKWDEDVNKFAEDPQTLIDHPELEGKVDEFKVFANEESNTNVPFKVLVTSFLYEQSKTAKPSNKGAMFPDGSGGPNEKPKPKSNKISVEESERLRQTDYNKYKELLKAGRIDNTVI